ncbi:hypothetical protein SUGI_0696940 [Cryptomeria japonica]|nr:hypothetical protein SUGI_0696940 [Cryptomeria japonica]
MATECQQNRGRIDPKACNDVVTRANIHQRPSGEFLQLNHELNDADPEVQPLLVKATNAQGNTALHLAGQGGFSNVVKALLQSKENGVDVRNELNETALFKAYERGNLATVDVRRAYWKGRWTRGRV